jgi:nitrite reductase (NADH) large subunit
MMRYVLIGIGVASIAAAEAIRSRDPQGEIILIGDDPHGYYSRPGLAYYLTGEIQEASLFPKSDKQLQELQLRWMHARVMCIDPQIQQLTLQNGKSLGYDRCLVAIGAEARMQDNLPQGVDSIVKLDSLEDARRIRKLSRMARTAVVVGGGITALELVEGLRAKGVKVYYFLRGDRYWSNVLDETESRIVEDRLRQHGVQLHFHSELGEVRNKGGKLIAVRSQDGHEFGCDLLAVAIGIKPRIGLARAIGLTVDRGILVDEFMQTSAPGIYAAGDVAQVYDPQSGKFLLDSLWWPARQTGYTAGLNMVGDHVRYTRTVAFNVTRLAGLTTTIVGTVGRGEDQDLVGIARGDSEIWRQLPHAIAAQGGFDVNHLRLMIGENRLHGGIIMGDQALSHPIHELVMEQVDTTAVHDQWLNAGDRLADQVLEFWTKWKAEHARQPS